MNDILPTDYAALHVPRSLSADPDPDGPSRGGGVSIVHRESVVVRRHRLADEFRPSTCELQVVRVSSSPSLAYTVFHIYRPPWMSTVPAFADDFADMIATFAAKCNDHIIICGDLNCPGTDSSHVDERLSTVFDSFGLSETTICWTFLCPVIRQRYATCACPTPAWCRTIVLSRRAWCVAVRR